MSVRRLSFSVVATIGCAGIAFLVVDVVPDVGFVIRGLLAAVLLLAGVAKLRDRGAFSAVLLELGVPGAIRGVIAAGLPWIELAVVGLLLVPVTSGAGAIAALVLLSAFTAVAGAALARGRVGDCGCFGDDHATPLGARALLRNGLLIGLAGGVAGLTPQDLAAPGRSVATVGIAALLGVGFLVWRRRNSHAGQESTFDVQIVGSTTDAAVTRRRWIGAAGGAGLVGLLGWLDPPTARAVGGRSTAASQDLICGNCICCMCNFDLLGHCFSCGKYCCFDCPGFSGGGVVQTSSGTAQASFFGDTVQLKGRKGQLVSGALSWFDSGWQGTGLLLQSTRITSYRRVPGTAVRELVGLGTANGQGKHKFVLRVVDSGTPGSGVDMVNLSVSGVAGGGAGGTGSQYAASGRLIQGDLTVKLQTRSTIT